MDLSLNVRRDDRGATTVDVAGEIDLGSSSQLLEYTVRVMHEHGPWLAVDLAHVTFMDCGGVRVLLAIRSRARMLGGQLWLVSTSAPVRRVLDIIGIDSARAFPEPSTVDDSRTRRLHRWQCFLPVKAGAIARHTPAARSADKPFRGRTRAGTVIAPTTAPRARPNLPPPAPRA